MELHPRMLRSGHCAHPDNRAPKSSHERCAGFQRANPEKLVQLCSCQCHYGRDRVCAVCGRTLVLALTPGELGDVWVHVESETGLAYFAVNCTTPYPKEEEKVMSGKLKKGKKSKEPKVKKGKKTKEPKVKKGKKTKEHKAKETKEIETTETYDYTLADETELYECGCDGLIMATTDTDSDGDTVYVHVNIKGEIIGGPICSTLIEVHA